jgi:hypothetical protein
MATIVIKDLPDSVDLDREAMLAITGGARTRGRQTYLGQGMARTTRIVNFPTGFATGTATTARTRTTGNAPKK